MCVANQKIFYKSFFAFSGDMTHFSLWRRSLFLPNLIKNETRWSMINQLVMSARSPLSGASIFHTYPLSQLCPVSFISSSTSHGVFRGCLHNSQSKESCGPLLFTLHAGRTKVFQWWRNARKLYHFLRVLCKRHRVLGEIKEPPHISVLKIKRDRVDSRVQLLWRLRVIGSSVC